MEWTARDNLHVGPPGKTVRTTPIPRAATILVSEFRSRRPPATRNTIGTLAVWGTVGFMALALEEFWSY